MTKNTSKLTTINCKFMKNVNFLKQWLDSYFAMMVLKKMGNSWSILILKLVTTY